MRKKLRALRLQRELTLENVAQIIGLTKSAYGNIESGRRWPSSKIIIRMELFFGIPASDLLAESEEEAFTN